MGLRIADTIRDQIADLYMSGLSSTRIVKDTGLSERTILRIVRERNLPTRERKRPDLSLHPSIVAEYLDYHPISALCDKYKTSHNVICDILRASNIKQRDASQSRQQYRVNESFFEYIDTPEKAYVLGFLWADGHNDIKHNNLMLRLQTRDREILVKIRDCLGSTHPIKNKLRICVKQRLFGSVNLVIKNKKISSDLLTLGMVQNKTYFPQWPLLTPNLESHFIRGFFDGDGCWHVSRVHPSGCFCGSLSFVGHIALMEKTREIIKRHTGLEFTTHILKNKQFSVISKAGKKDMLTFGAWLYANANGLYLERKHAKYLETIDWVNQ